MRRVEYLAVVVLIAAAVTGCGSSAASAAPTPITPAATPAVTAPAATPGACSLRTSAEAAAARGGPGNAGAPAVDPTHNVCSFGGTALADMTKFVEIEVVNPVEFTPTRASVPGTFEITPVSGLGDAAYYQKDILPNNSGTRWSLSVQKGPTVIRLDIVNPGAADAAIKTAENSLALAALTRLG